MGDGRKFRGLLEGMPREDLVKTARTILKRKGMWSRKKPAPAVRVLKASTVLDVGCGNGRNMIFPTSIGLDIDERALVRAKDNGEVVMGDAHYLPFRDKCVDISMLCYVINFIRDPTKALSEAERVSQRKPLVLVYKGAKQALWKF